MKIHSGNTMPVCSALGICLINFAMRYFLGIYILHSWLYSCVTSKSTTSESPLANRIPLSINAERVSSCIGIVIGLGDALYRNFQLLFLSNDKVTIPSLASGNTTCLMVSVMPSLSKSSYISSSNSLLSISTIFIPLFTISIPVISLSLFANSIDLLISFLGDCLLYMLIIVCNSILLLFFLLDSSIIFFISSRISSLIGFPFRKTYTENTIPIMLIISDTYSCPFTKIEFINFSTRAMSIIKEPFSSPLTFKFISL